jgi:TonB family protein
MANLICSRWISLFLLLLTPLAASAQTPQDYLKTYASRQFLLREYGGQDETIKVKKENATKYKGLCDVAIEVHDARLAKQNLEFKVEVDGFVTRVGTTQLACPHPSQQTKTVIISGLRGQETQADLENAISHVLLSPDAYLDSYGVSAIPQVDDPETPVITRVPIGGTGPRLVLSVNPTYPAGFRQAGVSAQVAIGIIIGRDGRVHEPMILHGTGSAFDTPMLRVLPLWRYMPAQQDGQPVAMHTTVTTSFFIKP